MTEIPRQPGKIIDLRSDTVTKPTAEMREAMKNAAVGDDILRDDPTVIELEELSAGMFGKEAALLTISGTMSNEIAVMAFTRPGDEIVVFADSHLYNLEAGGISALSGAQPRPLKSDTGVYDTDELSRAIMPPGVQRARTRLICLENSFHLDRGLAVERSRYADTVEIARRHGLRIFMDGARIFNAALATGTKVDELTGFCDAVDVCLCKGLAAPLGSMLMGSRGFIDEARRIRQRIGGGMRQAGVIAAPGILALTRMVERLSEDHENAETLRQGLESMGLRTDRGGILTNIVNLDVSPAGWRAPLFAERLSGHGIRAKVCTEQTLRMVLHNDIGARDVSFVVDRVGKILLGRG